MEQKRFRIGDRARYYSAADHGDVEVTIEQVNPSPINHPGFDSPRCRVRRDKDGEVVELAMSLLAHTKDEA